ncbi:MAG: DUF4079 domain-containing protein [Pseudanabaenaceae cyanobacterium]
MWLANALGDQLSVYIKPIAAQFSQLGIPAPIVHWGHPFFMSVVILAMGSYAGITGWKIRREKDDNSRSLHKRVSLWMTTFLAMGYTGGLLSLVMQGQPLLESPHFWTGSLVLVLLGINGSLSLFGFGNPNPQLAANFRSVHAYLGTGILALLLFHGILGLKLGLSI